MSLFIEEFLYRGRAPNSGVSPSWHVVIGEAGTDGFGQPFVNKKIFNVAQAAAAGYPLGAVLAQINAEALAEADTLRQSLSETISSRDGLAEELDKAKAEADTLRQSLLAATPSEA